MASKLFHTLVASSVLLLASPMGAGCASVVRGEGADAADPPDAVSSAAPDVTDPLDASPDAAPDVTSDPRACEAGWPPTKGIATMTCTPVPDCTRLMCCSNSAPASCLSVTPDGRRTPCVPTGTGDCTPTSPDGG